MSKIDTKKAAVDFVLACEKYGWLYSFKPTGVVTIYKGIEEGSTDSFCKADSEYGYILSFVPTSRPGSVWGTDGGGVGALSAVKKGVFTMNKSGVNKNFIKHLDKMW